MRGPFGSLFSSAPRPVDMPLAIAVTRFSEDSYDRGFEAATVRPWRDQFRWTTNAGSIEGKYRPADICGPNRPRVPDRSLDWIVAPMHPERSDGHPLAINHDDMPSGSTTLW